MNSSNGSPLVSVVIPVYNCELYIRPAILSVLNQTVKDLELIIINDGSTDNSEAVIKETVAEFPDRRIEFISRENRGVCRTLNEGLEHCSGKYFSYIGSDDMWDERKTELQVAELERTGFRAAFSDCWVIDSDGQVLSKYGDQFPYRGGDIYMDVVLAKFQPASPTVLFRRDAVKEVGQFVDEDIFEDRDLWVRIARNYKVAYVDQPLASYRTHSTNSSKNLESHYGYSLDVISRAIDADPSLETLRNRLVSHVDAVQAGMYYENLQLSDARSYAIKALKRRPSNFLAWRTLLLGLLGTRAIDWIRQKRRNRIARVTTAS